MPSPWTRSMEKPVGYCPLDTGSARTTIPFAGEPLAAHPQRPLRARLVACRARLPIALPAALQWFRIAR